jgi:Kef-type K+ transport system membrane component KefB
VSSAELIRFFAQIAVMLGAATLCGQVATRLRVPAVLGELVGGILLGPTVFGTVAPGIFSWVFPAEGATLLARDALLKIGMLFFMFVAGLEVDLSNLRQHGRRIAWVASAGMLVPFALGVSSVLLAPAFWGDQADRSPALFALFLGTALAISALPVIARILIDLNLIKQPVGVIVMAAATIDDIAGWALFGAILSSIAPGDVHGRPLWLTLALVAALFASILTVGRLGARRFITWARIHLPWPSGLIAAISVLILLAAAAVEANGMHAVLGAFLVGVAFAPSAAGSDAAREQAHRVIAQFALSFFAPLYFVSLGLKVNFADHFNLALILVVLVVACLGKIAGASIGARLGGMPAREALAVGFGMNARGAIEIILAGMALEHGLIDQQIFVALVVMALVTSIVSAPVMQRLLADRPLRTPAPMAVSRALGEDKVL